MEPIRGIKNYKKIKPIPLPLLPTMALIRVPYAIPKWMMQFDNPYDIMWYHGAIL
jgi:hypothetical protein